MSFFGIQVSGYERCHGDGKDEIVIRVSTQFHEVGRGQLPPYRGHELGANSAGIRQRARVLQPLVLQRELDQIDRIGHRDRVRTLTGQPSRRAGRG